MAAGILLSRLAGLVRQRVLAHALGLGEAADAFSAAFRIPNFLQNLLGEGVLSASFIPVYTRLRQAQGEEEARNLAGAVLGFLAVIVALVVALGVTFAPALVIVLAPGFEGAKQELTVRLVRVLFPGTGLLVFSAWCLGVLNSHRRFFLSYAAPVAWNAAIVVATLAAPGGDPGAAAVWAAWGALAGAVLQLGVQLPPTWRVAGGIRPLLRRDAAGLPTTVRTFLPALAGRGVVQVSAFVDGIIASLLPTGGVAALLNAQLVYTLPVSLFGVSVAASELPELAEAAGASAATDALHQRIRTGLRRIVFFVVPSATALLLFGGLIAAAIFQTGRFTSADAHYVWFILMGSAPGLLAATRSRLLASGCYALHDTVHPLRAAAVRVAVGTILGYVGAVHLPGWLGVEARWGAVGLTLAGSIAGWIEYGMLRRALTRRIGPLVSEAGHEALLLLTAVLAAGAGWGVLLLVGVGTGPVLVAGLVLGTFGTAYLALAWVFRVPEARALLDRLAAGS
ncbi:MAG TPA: murein biosynthesis integral membrane protein MurJ [Gemmatimonadales bacterium]